MLEFTVNKYITLKLENGTTNIYIKGELFRQCKFLLLFFTEENLLRSEEIESIDETLEYLDFSLNPDVEWIERKKQEIINGISHNQT